MSGINGHHSASEIEALACKVWGQPNRQLSSRRRRELRFGSQGSKSVRLDTGEWFDHEAGKGGGYRDLFFEVHGTYPPNGHDDGIVATYDYRDAAGHLVFQVVRKMGHKFVQRRPNGDGWVWNLHGVNRALYRLPELLAAPKGELVFIPEGEKDVETLRAKGLTATCNPGGAGKWDARYNEHLRERDVVVLPDNDQPGEDHGADVASNLRGIAHSVRVLPLPDLPPKGDVSDWFGAGHTVPELLNVLELFTEPQGASSTIIPPDSPQAEFPQTEWRDVRLADWASRQIPDRQWIVPDWIPAGHITGLYGAPGVNKTDFLLQLLMAASLGLVFIGVKLPTLGPVYGLFCEDTEEEIVRRAARIAEYYGLSLSDFPDLHFASLVGFEEPEFIVFDGARPPTVTEAFHRLNRKITELGAKLVALDTIPDFFGGNEIVRREVTKFMRRLDAVASARNCAITFTAHPSVRGRASGTHDSGSTGWEGKVRSRLSLHDPGDDDEKGVRSDRRILTRRKANYAAPGEEIELVWRDGVFTPAALDPERAAARGPLRDRQCEETFLRLLRIITEQGRYVHDTANSASRYAPALFSAMPEGKEFSQPEYRRAMQRLFTAQRVRMGEYGRGVRARPCIVET